MKRVLSMIFVFVILFASMSTAMVLKYDDSQIKDLKIRAVNKYSDVNENSWYLENVSVLSDLKIISGFSDGTFKPNDSLSEAQFIKLVITALGYNDIKIGDFHWAENYIKKAYELDIISQSFNAAKNYDQSITRGMMANILSRALKDENNEEDLEKYRSYIKDYNKLDDYLKISILDIYSKGIIAGYPDGEFKAEKTLNRAEGSTVIYRLIDKSKRKQIVLKENEQEYKYTDKEDIDIEGEARIFAENLTRNVLYGENYILLKENEKEYIENLKLYINNEKFKVNGKELNIDNFIQNKIKGIKENEILRNSEVSFNNVNINGEFINISMIVKSIYIHGKDIELRKEVNNNIDMIVKKVGDEIKLIEISEK